MPAVPPLCKGEEAVPVTCDNPLIVFNRIYVDFLIQGSARVTWEISPHFHAPEPWTFQIQESETDIPDGNWVNAGDPVQNTCFALDPIPRATFGKELNIFYRVQLTDANGVIYYSDPATVFGHLDFRSWNHAREIIRKERLRLKALRVGIPGWLLKIKRSGTPCPSCLDPLTQEVTNSNCPVCFGSRWSGGYYTPQPDIFADVTFEPNYQQRDEQGMGMVNPKSVNGMFVGQPYLSTMDVWVNDTSDVRYHIHGVNVRTGIRGVPLLVVAEMRPIPSDNVVYTFPVSRTFPPCPTKPGC